MPCPYLKDGHCSLAEVHAKAELNLYLACVPSEAICDTCLKSGVPCETKPSIQCVGLVTRQLNGDRLTAWRKYVGFLLFGKSRGLGDTIAKATKATGVDRLAKAAAKAMGKSGCGCGARQRRLNAAVAYGSKDSSAETQEKS